MITRRAIDEFKEIYSQKYGIVLSDSDATTMANDFFNFFCAVVRPKKTGISDKEFHANGDLNNVRAN